MDFFRNIIGYPKLEEHEREIRRLEEQTREEMRKQRELEGKLRDAEAKEEELKRAAENRAKEERLQREATEDLKRQLQEIKLQQSKKEEEEKNRRDYLEPLKKPWRMLSSKWEDPWTPEFKMELLQRINAIRPVGGIPYFNILLLGQAAAGKSSFFNTCVTAIRDEEFVSTITLVYEKSEKSVTTKLETFPMITKDGEAMRLRLYDCRGLNIENGVPTGDIEAIVKGHVQNGYQINPAASIQENDQYYRKNPGTQDRIHCVVYVVNAENPFEELVDLKTKEQLRFVRENLANQHLPQIVLLNKIDKLRISNTHDLRDIFRSQDVRDACAKTSEYMQIPLMNVFPMSNYFEEGISNTEKNILALFYLLTMMQKANDFIMRLTNAGTPRDYYSYRYCNIL